MCTLSPVSVVGIPYTDTMLGGCLHIASYPVLTYMYFCLLMFMFVAVNHCPLNTLHTVTNLTAVNTTTNSTTITWDQPPQNYNVWLYGEATDNIPQNRSIDLINVTGQTTLSIGGLNSFRNYSISVYLETEMGNGSDATVTVQTLGRGECVCVCVCVCVHVTE